MLEQDNRLKEDEIYRLRATIEDIQDCAPSRSERGSRSSEPAEPEAETPRRRHGSGAPGGTKPLVEMPSQPTSEVPEALKGSSGSLPPLDVPQVPEELRGPSKPFTPRDRAPAGPATKPTTRRSLTPDRDESDGPVLEKSADEVTSRAGRVTMASRSGSAVAFTPSGDSRRVAAIALNRSLTGGINTGQSPGDQGLLVVVEPRDHAGRTLDAPAEMAVVVLDPALKGDAMRVARWDFSAAEIAAMFRRTGAREAIHITTTWPGDPPVHDKLRLFVRYVTADGRKLQADMPIEVALPGDETARWSPSDLPAESDPSPAHAPARIANGHAVGRIEAAPAGVVAGTKVARGDDGLRGGKRLASAVGGRQSIVHLFRLAHPS